MATSAILNFINMPKASTHYGEDSYDVSWSLMKEIKKKIKKSPLFYFIGYCGKVCPTDSDFFGLSRSTRCVCDRKHYCKKFVKFGVNLTFFAPWLPWQRLPFWIFSTPKNCHTLYGWYSYKVSWSLMKGIPKIFKSPFFCFHGNCDKVCPTDSVFFLAYLVPLDVDVVPIKFHQFLFVPTMFNEAWW